MLLVHQVGNVKVGEVVRYTITYIPSRDRILPSPERLYLRIRNTSALVLRGAFVHGPYTLSAAAYPASFDPNEKFQSPRRYGVPEFEPMVKAASSWECELVVPEHVRQQAGVGSRAQFGNGPEHDDESVSWVVEVASQVIFSASAAVSFEVTVARDKKSLDLSSASSIPGAQPGKVSDHQPSFEAKPGRHHAPHNERRHHAQHNERPDLRLDTAGQKSGRSKGVYSAAIRLSVEDTGMLWNKPSLPQWEDGGTPRTAIPADELCKRCADKSESASDSDAPRLKQKKVHLVVLSHGLHSNLGADLLFLKESIDTAVKNAKADAKLRRKRERAEKEGKAASEKSSETSKDGDRRQSRSSYTDEVKDAEKDPNRAGEDSQGENNEQEDDDDDDDEQVIVRGFSGNATRTERGIGYLGKRLARYILSMTYPDQPYLPPSSKATWASQWTEGAEPHSKHHGDVEASGKDLVENIVRPFKITSISFIGHSLGGLIQTYAIAYCQKHSPEIFNLIKPINFITLATPFLGLGNENPLYVKFALDSGLVGRTGQDLGLTWRAPTLARSGFDALMSNLGEMAHKKLKGDDHPEAKPLLRILPTGPAHTALKKFRNRTVYSNVVNDGIVPLRTSCLLFLDWQGMGRVDKARRDAGLVGTAISVGWAELTGANHLGTRRAQLPPDEDEQDSGSTTPGQPNSHVVPQPAQDAMLEDDRHSLIAASIGTPYRDGSDETQNHSGNGTFGGFFSNLFRSSDEHKSPGSSPKPRSPAPSSPRSPGPLHPKQSQIYRRSQTLKSESSTSMASSGRSGVTNGSEFEDESEGGWHNAAPPRTTLFESAHDLLNPVVPDLQYLLDPAKRPRTIFHDRVYHPEDIPPAPLKRRTTTNLIRKRESPKPGSTSGLPTPPSASRDDHSPGPGGRSSSRERGRESGGSGMRVEEKIARAYHADLSWRKVLVKLEPDAHNNIIVRRTFANAFGWPVVHHLVEAHFSDSSAARVPDAKETSAERAPAPASPAEGAGKEEERTSGEREARDAVPDLRPRSPSREAGRRGISRADSVTWSERDWVDSEAESDGEGKGDEGWNWTEKIVGKGSRGKGSGEGSVERK